MSNFYLKIKFIHIRPSHKKNKKSRYRNADKKAMKIKYYKN